MQPRLPQETFQFVADRFYTGTKEISLLPATATRAFNLPMKHR
jgi:hypothetical protein